MIASPEIGAIGYYSQRRVMDLRGVVTPQLIHELLTESSEDVASTFGFATVARPDYLIDRSSSPYSLLERSRYASALVPIGHAPEGHRVGDSIYSFYRIDWPAFDSVRTTR
jgi:hypothetical protein